MATVKFKKYEGLGNDFIVIDAISSTFLQNIFYNKNNLVYKLCNRNIGIGADGILLMLPSNTGSIARMEIFNSDGSIPEMCGNGIRCLVKYIDEFTKLTNDDHFKIETKAGDIEASISNDGQVRINMGSPTFNPTKIPTSFNILQTVST